MKLIKSTLRYFSSSSLISKYNKDNCLFHRTTSSYAFFKQSSIASNHNFNGRIANIRDFPNLSFVFIEVNPNEIIQLVINKDKYSQIKKTTGIKSGQIISVSGKKILTKTGAESLEVEDFNLITDCDRPIPKPQQGLKDFEVKYEKRYLDFLSNPKNKDILLQRHKIINYLRQYLINKDFIEVETPILSTTKSGALATPFMTKHSALKKDLFLRVAPEIHLKKLIVSGFNRIFEIGKNFRNEDISVRHNPEFSSCELYSAYWNYKDLISFTENFIKDVFRECYLSNPSKSGSSDGIEHIDTNSIKYIDIIEILENKLNTSLKISDEERFKSLIIQYYSEKHKQPTGEDFNEILNTIIENDIESLVDYNPCFILHHPISISPLAKRMDEYPLFTERFEVFIRKMEIINAYTELNDYKEQEERFKKLYNNQLQQSDKDFVEALAYGMPPTGGWGIGLDRLIMILTCQSNIKDVIAFPIMNKRI